MRTALRWSMFLIAALLAAPHAGAATLRVGNSSATAFDFLPLQVAIDQKFFARNGLTVEEVDVAGSSKLHQAMIAGGIDVGLGSGTDIVFLVKGAPEMAVGSISLSAALFGISIPYDSPVRTLADLKGKRFGVSTVGSLTEWLALQVGRKEGWTRDDITLITDGSTTPPQIAALETGQIDAQVSAAALGWFLETQKKGRLLAPASDFVGPFLMNVVFASDAILKRDPGAVRAFLKSWYEATNFMAQNRAATIAAEDAADHFSDAVNTKQYDTVMPSLSLDGRYPKPAVAALARSFVELKLLPTEPDMTKYLTTRFLPAAP